MEGPWLGGNSALGRSFPKRNLVDSTPMTPKAVASTDRPVGKVSVFSNLAGITKDGKE